MQIGATQFSSAQVSSTQGVGRTTRIDHSAHSIPRPASAGAVDQLDISPEAQRLSQALETRGGDFRADKVAEMKAKIADGGYDSDEKLDMAMSRMLDDLFG